MVKSATCPFFVRPALLQSCAGQRPAVFSAEQTEGTGLDDGPMDRRSPVGQSVGQSVSQPRDTNSTSVGSQNRLHCNAFNHRRPNCRWSGRLIVPATMQLQTRPPTSDFRSFRVRGVAKVFVRSVCIHQSENGRAVDREVRRPLGRTEGRTLTTIGCIATAVDRLQSSAATYLVFGHVNDCMQGLLRLHFPTPTFLRHNHA